MAQHVSSPLSKLLYPTASAISYLAKRLSSGRARRTTEVSEPETNSGHHCIIRQRCSARDVEQ